MNMNAIIKPFRDNWVLIAALFALGSAWGVNTWRVNAAETAIATQKTEAAEVHRDTEQRVRKTEEAISTLTAVQAAQQATATAQQQSLERIDRNLESIAEQLRN